MSKKEQGSENCYVQYRKYKEVYKIDINLLKELINNCGEFNDEMESASFRRR